jgi:amino acid permease
MFVLSAISVVISLILLILFLGSDLPVLAPIGTGICSLVLAVIAGRRLRRGKTDHL